MARKPSNPKQRLQWHFKRGERYGLTSIVQLLLNRVLFAEVLQIIQGQPPLGLADAHQSFHVAAAFFTLATARFWKMRQRTSRNRQARINDFDPDSFCCRFRFRPEQVRLLLSEFGWLDSVGNSTIILAEDQGASGWIASETMLLIVLRLLARPMTIEDIIDEMGCARSLVGIAFEYGTKLIYAQWAKPLNNFYAWRLWFDEFAERIWQKGSLFRNCICFVDGIFVEICRPGGPKNFHALTPQSYFYNGYEKCHGLKYIGAVFPNGILLAWGPFYGSQHDSPLLMYRTPILAALRRLFYRLGRWYIVFGDSAFASTRFIQRMIKGAAAKTVAGQLYNNTMAPLRVDIEHAFREIQRDWAAIKWTPGQCLGLRPLGRYFHVGVFLHNCMGILNGTL
eukprot:CAMPEP_0181320950 /NCGR_PEP_ID=MMETSP1101-20121128/18408_1 /TAXON_ID=46948 /ORGANISM="Rhodomonas abbreviata, Strain Caron Lab Isolate" /LENGTH=394 /DNA_ID=CAMNT_0023428711 /DNA_START=82 /DNA_END=1263 /DNA_ORIENTATION=+